MVRLELTFCKVFDYCCHVFLSRRLLLDPTPQYRGCRKLHSDAKPKDPFTLAQRDLKSLYDDIRKVHFFSMTKVYFRFGVYPPMVFGV